MFVFALASALGTLGVASAIAQNAAPRALGDLQVSVEPARGIASSPWLVYEVDPGASLTDDVLVANDSDIPRSLDLYAAHAHTLPSGAFDADLKGAQPTELGTWAKLDVSHVDLPAHTNRHVHVAIQVPSATEAGEYEGSVLAQFETGQSQQVHIIHRVGLRIYLTVKGAISESGRIDSVSTSPWWERGWPGDPVELRTTFVNSGKVHLNVKGSIKATGGTTPLTEANQAVVVLKNSRLILTTRLREHPWIGIQRVDIDASYTNRATGHATAAIDIWVIPWKALLLALAVLTIAAYVARRLLLWAGRSRTVAVSAAGATLRMTVVDPSDHPDGLPAAPPGQEVVVVAIQVANRGSKAFRFAPSRFQLLDSSNRSFTPDAAVSRALEDETDRQVEPGGREVVALGFVVPAEARARAGIYRSAGGNLIVEMVPWSESPKRAE